MKAVKIVYLIMNIVMVLACAGLAVWGAADGFSVLHLIAPVAAAALFAALVLPKTDDVFKKVMRVVLSSHIAVVIALTQAFFVFGVKAVNAAVILAIAAALVAFMVWALRRMLIKFGELGGKQEKDVVE